jgi:LPXTG-motif cell wall-anchored protein
MATISTRRQRPRRRIAPSIGALFLVPLGALLVLASFVNTGDPETEKSNGPIGVAGAVLVALGGLWLYRTQRREREELEQFHEREVLTVASRHEGRATAALVTVESELSAEEAQKTLERLCGKNMAQPDLLDDGTVVYLFGMLAPERA